MFILLGPDSEGQGVCPAARRGHFHLNRGPREPGGVTLATVKAIVPAVSECEKERRSKKSVFLKLNGTTKVATTGLSKAKKTEWGAGNWAGFHGQ